jgi:hypothetical protein
MQTDALAEGLTTFFEYVVGISLVETYLLFCIMVIVSIHDFIFVKQHRHLIKIENINILVFVVINLIIFIIVFFVYKEITIDNIILMIKQYSTLQTINDVLSFFVFMVIINFDSIVLMAVMIIVGAVRIYKNIKKLISRSPSKRNDNSESDPDLINKFAFVIVCHNSSNKIESTVDYIKNKCNNIDIENQGEYLIFISDNGSTKEEQLKTKLLTEKLRCIYLCLTKGSKTLSQFATVNYIKLHHKTVKYIVALDDDIVLPDTWSFSHVDDHFASDENIVAVAMPLTASNRVNSVTEYQHLEYLLAGHNKMMQSIIGTCLFGSGGFTVYLLDYFLEVITHHTTAFRGEDLQIGLLSHAMVYTKLNVYLSNKYKSPKIECCSKIKVATDVPVHWYHPKYKSNCKCGEPSFFKQRVTCWDPTLQRFVNKFAKILFSPMTLKNMSWRFFLVKFYCLYELLLVLNNWVGLMYLIVNLIFFDAWLNIIRTFFVSIVINLPFLLLIDLVYFRKEKIPLFILLSFNFYYRMFYSWIVRPGAMFFNLLKYWPTYKEPLKIMKQYLTNERLREELRIYWKLDEDQTAESELETSFEMKVYKISKYDIKEKQITMTESDDIDEIFDQMSQSDTDSAIVPNPNSDVHIYIKKLDGVLKTTKFVPEKIKLNEIFDINDEFDKIQNDLIETSGGRILVDEPFVDIEGELGKIQMEIELMDLITSVI